MKKLILSVIALVLLVGFPLSTNAGDYYHRHESPSLWKGYKGEGYYDYWYNPDRKRQRNEANKWESGQELKQPMGEYKMKGYIGGYRTHPDGTIEFWSHEVE